MPHPNPELLWRPMVTDGLIRMSDGVEGIGDILADLEPALRD